MVRAKFYTIIWLMEFEKNSLPLEENQHETNSNSKKNQS